MLAEPLDVVIGVDTHRDTHALAVVRAHTAELIHELTIEATAAGYRAALDMAEGLGAQARTWAVEGTGAYGAGLRRFLLARGERVIEIGRLARTREGSRPKSDPLDAVRAARSVLARPRQAEPRSDGPREAIRVLMVAREGAVAQRALAIVQLKALVVSAPDRLRERFRTRRGRGLLVACAALRPRASADPVLRATALALRSLARRALAATQEARALKGEIAALVEQMCPALLGEPGVGPITGARILMAFSHPGRFRNEAGFARLAGVAPIPASSGQVVRHRLDRGGDRQLNRALHTIILARRMHHPATRDYIARRRAEGRSDREAVRCLKRYLARHLFRLLEGAAIAA